MSAGKQLRFVTVFCEQAQSVGNVTRANVGKRNGDHAPRTAAAVGWQVLVLQIVLWAGGTFLFNVRVHVIWLAGAASLLATIGLACAGVLVVLVLLFGGGGGYYGYSRYGGAGLGGVLGTVLVVLIVLWLVGAVGHTHV